MPTIQESVVFTSTVPYNVIRMVKRGEFYRAHNRSAWLFQSCIVEYKVLRNYELLRKTST